MKPQGRPERERSPRLEYREPEPSDVDAFLREHGWPGESAGKQAQPSTSWKPPSDAVPVWTPAVTDIPPPPDARFLRGTGYMVYKEYDKAMLISRKPSASTRSMAKRTTAEAPPIRRRATRTRPSSTSTKPRNSGSSRNRRWPASLARGDSRADRREGRHHESSRPNPKSSNRSGVLVRCAGWSMLLTCRVRDVPKPSSQRSLGTTGHATGSLWLAPASVLMQGSRLIRLGGLDNARSHLTHCDARFSRRPKGYRYVPSCVKGVGGLVQFPAAQGGPIGCAAGRGPISTGSTWPTS